MSIDCRSVHGDHGFCHCVMSLAGSTPARPRDGEWARITGGDVTQFARAIFNLGQGEGRMMAGNLAGDGTLTSGMTRGGEQAVYVSLREAGTVQSRTAVLVETTAPIDVFNIINDDRGSHFDVWTAQGWTSVSGVDIDSYRRIIRFATAVDDKYYYRVMINGPGQRGLTLASSASFTAVLYKAPLLVQMQTMQIDEKTPALHLVLMKTMQDSTFPDGARLTVTAPDGTGFAEEALTEARFVKRTGQSLRALALRSPAKGTYSIEMIAIKGSGFHLLFQSTPVNDVMSTMRRALQTIYTDVPAEGGSSRAGTISCSLCLIGVTVIAQSLVLMAMTAAAAFTISPAGPIAAFFLTLGLTFTRSLLLGLASLGITGLSTAICYMLGDCDAPAELKKSSKSRAGMTSATIRSVT